jgi:hypothetical protein
MIARLLLLAMTMSVVGCDNIVALMADPKVAQRIADSKAIGSACRYGLRSIEDCYALNEKASKASMFDGWKEMDQYMRDNKIEGIPSTGVKAAPPADQMIEEKAGDSTPKDKAGASDSKAKPKVKPAEKAAEKAAH